MPHQPKLLALMACFVLACSALTDLSDLSGVDASSIDAAGDSSVADSSIDATNDATNDVAPNDGGTDGASATVSNVQIGPLAFVANGGSVSPTLQTASASGTLLVATVTCDSATSSIGAPAGWKLAVNGTGFANGSSIWYVKASGVTSATFTSSSGGGLAAQLSEWSGVTTLDQTGAASTSSTTTSVTVSTSAVVAQGGELGITAFGQATGQQTLITYTPGSGWSPLGASGTTRLHYAADYRIGVGPGTVSETVMSSTAATWAAAIATFK